MLRLYEKLSEYGVVMSIRAYNEFQNVVIKFDKDAINRRYVYTYDMACDPVRWQDMLIGHLSEFMFIYEQECKNKNELVD